MAMTHLLPAGAHASLGSVAHGPLAFRSLALFQADSINSGNSKLLMVFVGIAAFALLVQACALVMAAIGAAKAQKRIAVILEEVRAKAIPVLDQSQTFFTEVAPKLKDMAVNFHEISTIVRAKVEDFEPTIDAARITIDDANARTRAQVSRVDGMVTHLLTATAEIGTLLHTSIRTPMREVAGMITGVKVGLDTFLGRLLAPKVHAAPRSHESDFPDFAGVHADSRDIDL